ncbi:HHE domain-containing protein [Coprinopsis sp. MPI-PUGE-AT-0042]|nr:HHE domain-containing protein [Coprinopsis sp. MPI-PUGE-AT-0042]
MASESLSSNPLFHAVAEDHQEMYGYYESYQKASLEDKQQWANQLIWEIARHAVGEEIVVYPLMEKHLGQQGLDLTNKDRADHQKAKENLYKLESMQAGTSDYNTLLGEVMTELRTHNDSEEKEDLPLLIPKIGQEGSQEAAASFKRTKKFAPTHPHPGAPNKPPFETIVGMMTTPIDKLRDLFMTWPSEEDKKQAEQN